MCSFAQIKPESNMCQSQTRFTFSAITPLISIAIGSPQKSLNVGSIKQKQEREKTEERAKRFQVVAAPVKRESCSCRDFRGVEKRFGSKTGPLWLLRFICQQRDLLNSGCSAQHSHKEKKCNCSELEGIIL